MTADLAIEILIYGGAIPAAIAAVVVYFARQSWSETIAERYGMAAALAVAFVAGYALLPPWASLWPESHWQSLPHLAVLAMVLGPVGLARGVWISERNLVWLLMSLVAAWFVVPTWPHLDPPRQVYVPALAAYLFLLMSLLEPLARRLSPLTVLTACSLAAIAGAVFIVLGAKSMVYGQVAGIAAAVTVGCLVGAFFHPSVMMLRGLVPAWGVLVGGMGFIGYVQPAEPLWGMLLIPAAPLALWLSKLGPLVRLSGTSAILVETLLVIAVLAAGGVLIVISA